MLVRISAFVGGIMLLIVGIGGVILRQEPSEAYWMITQVYSEEAPYNRCYLTSPNGRVHRYLEYVSQHAITWCPRQFSPDNQWLYYFEERDLGRIRLNEEEHHLIIRNSSDLSNAHKIIHTPDGELILAVSEVDGEAAIFRSSLDGRDVFQITPTYDANIVFSVSPNNQWILYEVRPKIPNGRTQPVFVRIDGSNLRQIRQYLTWQWSPDGEWYIVRMDDRLWRMRPDGTQLEPITPTGYFFREIRWLSEDWILGCHYWANGLTGNLYRMRPDGSDLGQMYGLGFHSCNYVATKDRRWIYTNRGGLYRIEVETRKLTLVTHRVVSPSLLSADDRWILYNVETSEHPRQLWAMKTDDSEQHLLFEYPANLYDTGSCSHQTQIG